MSEPNRLFSDQALTQLRAVISDLGSGGGSMTPSIYETAQVLRFCPELVEADKVLDWLLKAQRPDGGWGELGPPLYRIVPTAAAILALHDYRSHERVRRACAAGQRFLEEQKEPVEATHGEYLPVAMELILPRLLDEAAERGIVLSRTCFRHLEELGERKRKSLAKQPPTPNSAPVFSWEAWGTDPEPELVTRAGVGHSSAATAWWLYLDKGRSSTNTARAQAIDYIINASHATGSGVRGIVPSPWPMNRFEQSFVLHTLVMSGLLSSRQLADVVIPQLENLYQGLAAGGLGFSGYFVHDGDDTAAAVATLTAAGFNIDYNILTPFQRPTHFVAYPFEAHASYAVTARATQALALTGADVTQWRRSLLDLQQPDGWWTSEKWNRSRLYGTSLALAALDSSAVHAKTAAAKAFVVHQHADGGWGCFGQSTLVETAFGILSLCNIVRDGNCKDEYMEAISAGHHYLHRMYDVSCIGTEHMWICKDLYSARRVDQAAILCAMLTPYTLPQF